MSPRAPPFIPQHTRPRTTQTTREVPGLYVAFRRRVRETHESTCALTWLRHKRTQQILSKEEPSSLRDLTDRTARLAATSIHPAVPPRRRNEKVPGQARRLFSNGRSTGPAAEPLRPTVCSPQVVGQLPLTLTTTPRTKRPGRTVRTSRTRRTWRSHSPAEPGVRDHSLRQSPFPFPLHVPLAAPAESSRHVLLVLGGGRRRRWRAACGRSAPLALVRCISAGAGVFRPQLRHRRRLHGGRAISGADLRVGGEARL